MVIEPMPLALAGRFFATEPPEKSQRISQLDLRFENSFPTENLCLWHQSLQGRHVVFYIIHVFLKGCVWIKFLCWETVLISISSPMHGENQIPFQTQWEALFYLRSHTVNFLSGWTTGSLIDLFCKFGFSFIRPSWIHLRKSSCSFEESQSGRKIKVLRIWMWNPEL